MKFNLKKAVSFLLAAAITVAMTACGEAVQPAQPADPSVAKVEKAIRINANDVEIYFAEGYTGTEKPETAQFVLKDSKGNQLELEKSYGYGGGVFFDNVLTLHTQQSFAESENSGMLTLEYNGAEFSVPFDAYYKYETTARCGVKVKGGRTLLLPEKTLARAAQMVDVLLG